LHPEAVRALEAAARASSGVALADGVATVRLAAAVRRRELAKPAPDVAHIVEVAIGRAAPAFARGSMFPRAPAKGRQASSIFTAAAS
jgi:hypothetical protein